MSGYGELWRLGGVVVRPLRDPKPPARDRSCPFSASLGSTVELLAAELFALKARTVVLELDVREQDLRLDGLPRATAVPTHPGVALAFESRFGPLRYATAEYRGASYRRIPAWQANLRAIALSMQALRAVDRYGVSKRGEQYQGWRALTTGDPVDAIQTAEQAWLVIADLAGLPPDASPLLLGLSEDETIRRALKRAHPDAGGNDEDFRRVIRAREILKRKD